MGKLAKPSILDDNDKFLAHLQTSNNSKMLGKRFLGNSWRQSLNEDGVVHVCNAVVVITLVHAAYKGQVQVVISVVNMWSTEH